jgi:polar amino acid transport system ATP-binding protein
MEKGFNYNLTDTILCVDNVSSGYGDKIILKDINIIEKNIVREGFKNTGQVIAILGPSGRGKSTLFKVLTGLKKPKTGSVLISDLTTEDIDDAKEVEEGDVGFVDQKYTQFRHKTVLDICKYALRKSKLTNSEKHQKIEHYLNEWNLIEHKDKYPNELSGGQRQRTAIIEQLLSDKHFFIFDEPFSGLDIVNIDKFKKAFEKIQSDNEYNTIIFSTHDVRLALELADSIYVIGRPEGVEDYSTVIKHYDLKALGLAWRPYSMQHEEVYKDIFNVFVMSETKRKIS